MDIVYLKEAPIFQYYGSHSVLTGTSVSWDKEAAALRFDCTQFRGKMQLMIPAHNILVVQLGAPES